MGDVSKCFICLHEKDDVDVAGTAKAIHWMPCGHWLHNACADENVTFMNLGSKNDIKCGLCKKTGHDCERDAVLMLRSPATDNEPEGCVRNDTTKAKTNAKGKSKGTSKAAARRVRPLEFWVRLGYDGDRITREATSDDIRESRMAGVCYRVS